MQQTYEGIGRNPNDTDNFECHDPDTINAALLNHLTTIDSSRSDHINQSEHMVNQCLQEAQYCGLFDHEESSVEFSDRLGMLTDTAVLEQEQDWIREYEQQKQIWKSNVIREQS